MSEQDDYDNLVADHARLERENAALREALCNARSLGHFPGDIAAKIDRALDGQVVPSDCREVERDGLAHQVSELRGAAIEVLDSASAILGGLRMVPPSTLERLRIALHRIDYGTRIAKPGTVLARLRAAQFSPMGDNHHNAEACPYCNPHGWTLQPPHAGYSDFAAPQHKP